METQQVRETRYDGVHCDLVIRQHPGGIVVMTVSGTDVGEFCDTPMLELSERLQTNGPIELFIDARDVKGASIDVSGEWARWLAAHKAQLRDIHMLTGSRFVHVTAGFVRRFAALEDIMRIYTEPAAFDAALASRLIQV